MIKEKFGKVGVLRNIPTHADAGGYSEQVRDVIPGHPSIVGQRKFREPMNEDTEKTGLMRRMAGDGYLVLKTTNLTEHNYSKNTLHATPTDKLKPYLNGGDENTINIVVAAVSINGVTGIATAPFDKDARVVEYQTKVVPNELAKYFTLQESELSTQTRQAIFKKYDDGWRLEN